jgi:hypothetical protein
VAGNCSLVNNLVHLTGAGSCIVTASQPGDDNFNPADDVSKSFNILPAPTSTALSANPASVQYSDVTTLTASVTPFNISGDVLTGSVEFFVNGASVGSSALDANGTGSLPMTITYAPGNNSVTASFTSTNSNFTNSSAGPVTLPVTQEDARATYNGNNLFWTTSFTSSNAKVTYVNRDTNTNLSGCVNLPVGQVSAGDTTKGVATCNTTLSLNNNNNSGGDTFTIGIIVSRYYTRNSAEDNTLITVAQPIPSNYITGGGSLLQSNSSGLVPGDAGSRNNFGFNVKFNKSGTNLVGRINIIVRSGGRVYQIKGNAISSLGVINNQANFTGKANIQDITDPLNVISVDGNAVLQMWMTDNGEPGTGDTLGIQVLNKNGGMWYSSSWSGTNTVEQNLAGGNLSVH